MELIGQRHAPANLSPGMNPVTNHWRTVWVGPSTRSNYFRSEKNTPGSNRLAKRQLGTAVAMLHCPCCVGVENLSRLKVSCMVLQTANKNAFCTAPFYIISALLTGRNLRHIFLQNYLFVGQTICSLSLEFWETKRIIFSLGDDIH